MLWALWQHYRIHRNLDFVVGLYSTLVVPAADWMVSYVDERNGLIKPSWDLWEERWGVHAFTVGAVWGGLDAARSFADLFGDVAGVVRYRDAADRLREAADTHLYSPELGRFRAPDRRRGRRHDDRRHGHRQRDLRPVAVRHVSARRAAHRRHDEGDRASSLPTRRRAGGIARYKDDYYFKVDPDTKKVPGNPWFICTLWLAQWYIATAKTHARPEARARHHQLGGRPPAARAACCPSSSIRTPARRCRCRR